LHFFPKIFNSLCAFSMVFLDRFDFETASQRGEWTQQHSATQEIIFSPMKELMNILFEITEKINGRTKPWHPLEHWSRSQVISINLLQVGQPLSVFTFPALTAMMEVVRISNSHFFRLVPH